MKGIPRLRPLRRLADRPSLGMTHTQKPSFRLSPRRYLIPPPRAAREERAFEAQGVVDRGVVVEFDLPPRGLRQIDVVVNMEEAVRGVENRAFGIVVDFKRRLIR